MRSSISFALAAFFGFTVLVAADWQYRSRPDLTPPRLNITVPAKKGLVEQGLIFVAPYPGAKTGSEGPVQPTAYIFRDDGDLVWSGLGYFAGNVANFGVETWAGEQVLRAFQGQKAETLGRSYGYHILLNKKYEPVKSVRGWSHKLGSAHEFRIVDNKFALVETGSTKPIGLSSWGGGEGQDWIISTGFQELNIETGDVIFDWESLDHIDPNETCNSLSLENLPPVTGVDSSHAWDYFHINSVDKDNEGNYIVSGRHTSAIYKINGTTGDVIWTLGGSRSSFDIKHDTQFAYQHDARLLSRSSDGNIEVISIFDNTAASASLKDQISPYSRARIIQLNHSDSTATALRTYPAPDSLSAYSQGNAQVLPNTNVFVNWGEAGAITEFSEDGEVLFHAYLDSGGYSVQNYRGFRSNWTGNPREEPVLLAIYGAAAGEIDAYISWNGDTEVAVWKFFAEPLEGRNPERILLGQVRRTGFETYLKLESSTVNGEILVSAQALDANNRVLANTNSVVILRNPLGPSGLPGKPSQEVSFEEL